MSKIYILPCEERKEGKIKIVPSCVTNFFCAKYKNMIPPRILSILPHSGTLSIGMGSYHFIHISNPVWFSFCAIWTNEHHMCVQRYNCLVNTPFSIDTHKLKYIEMKTSVSRSSVLSIKRRVSRRFQKLKSQSQ